MTILIKTMAYVIMAIASAFPSTPATGNNQRVTIVGNREARDRDKTGTSTSLENNTSSQAIGDQQLASRVSFEAEGKGFEPSTGFPAPDFESEIGFA
jgi:hypothetical protein